MAGSFGARPLDGSAEIGYLATNGVDASRFLIMDGKHVRVRGTPCDWLLMLKDRDRHVRHMAGLILGGLESTDDVPIDSLVDGLSSPDADIVFWCITALKRLESRSVAAVPLIADAARMHDTFGVRQVAVMALVSIAPRDPRTLEAVLHATQDANAFVRREATQALISIPDLSPAVLKYIEGLRTDRDASVARWTDIALRHLQPKQR